MEFLSEIFNDVWYWYTTIKLKKKLKISNALDEIPFKTCVFLHLFNNECIIITLFLGKPLPYQRGGDFKDGHCINCFIFNLFLVMFHE
jgi:hypothetical protein